MYSRLARFSLAVFAWACMLLLCVSVSAGADLKSAKRAYEQKDFAGAVKELTPLAEQGNADAQLLLGEMYMKGQGVLKDPGQAMKWFRASGEQSNANAQFFLGAMYLLPGKDIIEGMKWLRLSAEQGQQDAQLLLGKTYLQGAKGVPRDPVQAEMWLRLAAEHNLPFYQNELQVAEQQINAAQIAKGKALADAWKPKYGLRPGDRASTVNAKDNF